MKPIIITATFLFLFGFFFSCGSEHNKEDSSSQTSSPAKEISVNFDADVSIKDLYSLDKKVNAKLSNDQECVEFFNDYLTDWVDFENSLFTRIEYINTIAQNNKKLKSLEKSDDVTELIPETYKAYKSTKSMFKGVEKTALNGMSLLSLEKRRTKLYNSFSKEKQTCALAVEIIINSIIYDSYYKPLNQEMKEAKAGTNFRCVGEQLNDDEKAIDFLKNISDGFMEFQMSYRELRAKIFINKITRDSTDYSELVDLGEKIIAAKGNLEFSIKQEKLNNFFEHLSELCKKINYDKDTFSPPVEDWSEEKKNNFNMVINDIQNKMQAIVKNINEAPKQGNWSPWDSRKK